MTPDTAAEVADLDPETPAERVVEALGTSYGISIGAHVAILLVLTMILIAKPSPEAAAGLQVGHAIESLEVEERRPAPMDAPPVPAADTLETAIVVHDEIRNEVPRGTSLDDLFEKNLIVEAPPGDGGSPSLCLPPHSSRSRLELDGGAGTEDVVREALTWLAKHQSEHGGWEAAEWTQQCTGERCPGPSWNEGSPSHDVGLTGLATLAFLGNGHTHRFARTSYHRVVVRRALLHLRRQQGEDGSIGMKGAPEHLYDHAIATTALCEAYAITRDFELRRPAQRATAFLIAAQDPDLGGCDGVRSGQKEAWFVLALQAARMAQLEVPDAAFEGAHAWFKRATEAQGDAGRMTGESSLLGVVDGPFDHVPTNTAVAVLGRVLLGDRRAEDALRRGCKRLLADRPSWLKVNFDYWHYGSYAMFQLGGQAWHDWNDAMKAALLPTVRRGGCADGSWDPVWSIAGGRVYATAINALTLEVYYRYGRAREGVERR